MVSVSYTNLKSATSIPIEDKYRCWAWGPASWRGWWCLKQTPLKVSSGHYLGRGRRGGRHRESLCCSGASHAARRIRWRNRCESRKLSCHCGSCYGACWGHVCQPDLKHLKHYITQKLHAFDKHVFTVLGAQCLDTQLLQYKTHEDEFRLVMILPGKDEDICCRLLDTKFLTYIPSLLTSLL